MRSATAEALAPPLRVSVPGKVMLAGEYAVLRGAPALAVTTVRAMQIDVMFSAASDPGSTVVTSELWQAPRTIVHRATQTPPHEALEQVVRELQLLGRVPTHVHVDASLCPTWGVGSSSALRLGVLLGGLASPWTAAAHALRLQRAAQPSASGYDICTQTRGGLVLVQPPANGSPLPAEPLAMCLATKSLSYQHGDILRVMVGGAGAPTGDTMRATGAWLEERGVLSDLVRISREIVPAFVTALTEDARDLGPLLRLTEDHRSLMAQSPRFPGELARVLNRLPGRGTTWSWKTTGAGGEDALLLVGRREHTNAAADALQQLGWTDLPGGLGDARITINGRLVHADA